MNDLYNRQQEPFAVDLLAAQKQAYIEGKLYNKIILAGYVIGGIVVPILAVGVADQNWMGMIAGLIGILLSLPLNNWVEKKKLTGATIQEQFDYFVYGWKWKISDKGVQIAPFKINRLKRNLKDWSNLKPDGKEADTVKPWYADYSSLSTSQAILSCQIENLYWDSTQKRRFARVLKIVFFCFCIFGISGFFVPGQSPIDALLKVLIPVIGVLIYLGLSIEKITRTSNKLDRLMPMAQKLGDTYLQKEESIPKKELKEIQATIFASRKEGYLVPEGFFKKGAKGLEEDINSGL